METIYAESLWNLLSLRRVVLLTEHGQDPFSRLPDQYRTPIEIDSNSSTTSSSSTSDSDSETASSTRKEDDQDRCAIDHIRKHKRYPNTENLFNLLDFLYKFITYKLVPTSEEASDETNFNIENNLVDFLGADSIELLGGGGMISTFELAEFNLENIKLKHIHHVWRYLIGIYSEVRN